MKLPKIARQGRKRTEEEKIMGNLNQPIKLKVYASNMRIKL